MKNGFFNCSTLYYDYFIDRVGYRSTASTTIQNVTFILASSQSSYNGGYFRSSQGAGLVIFENNRLFWGDFYYDVISMSGDDVIIRNNDIANMTTDRNLIVLSGSSSTIANNNSISYAKADSSIVKLDGSAVSLELNVLVGLEAEVAIELGSNMDELEMVHNAFIDPIVEYYIKTESEYKLGDGAVIIGANYWSSIDFDHINEKTYDSFYDAGGPMLLIEILFILNTNI